MGAFLSYFWWGGHDADAKNSVSGLSLRDIYNIRKSWPKVSTNGIESGTELLVRYFTQHPEYKEYFSTFKVIPTDELKANRQFQAHSLNIITSLTDIINNLHQPDLAIVMCEKLGTSHARRHIKELHFNDLKDVLVEMYIKDLQFDESTMESWVRGVTFIFTNIFSKLENTTKP